MSELNLEGWNKETHLLTLNNGEVIFFNIEDGHFHIKFEFNGRQYDDKTFSLTYLSPEYSIEGFRKYSIEQLAKEIDIFSTEN